MIDFPIQAAMAPGLAMLARPEKPASIPAVKGSNTSGDTSLQNNQNQAKNNPTELQLHLARNRPNDRLVGPPPSFQANVLEIESSFNFVIQQLEVKREQLRNGDAVTANDDTRHSNISQQAENSNQSPTTERDQPTREPARDRENDDLS